MSDADLERLTRDQLEQRREAVLRRLEAAQNAYNTQSRNLSEDPGGHMPVTSMSELQALDDELRSVGAELEAIERELQRRQ